MNKRLLLINLPGESIRMPEEHCGLAFLKAYIEKYSFGVDILDAYARKMNLDKTITEIDEWMKLFDACELYIGISPFVTSHESFVAVGSYVKKTNFRCIVFAGGHYASLNREVLIKYKWLDAIIVGEGELTLLEFMRKGLRKDIPGLYVGQDNRSFIFRERIKNLDSLPYQDRYLSKEQLNGQPMAITTSRGCYGECSFCSISSFYKLNGKIKQTYRSADSVANEIRFLVKKHNIDSLKIVDDNFFRDNSDSFLESLAKQIEDLHLSIRLSARPNDITENRAYYLRKMGVVIIGIGVESADERSLEFFNKGIGIEASYRAIEILNKYGITCLVNYIMFNPIIDLNGLKKNLDFINKYRDSSVFHRINSHLWIRSTDPLVDKLVEYRLCDRKGFPYVESKYANENVFQIMELFDQWCNHNMKEYYENVDVLMAKGIQSNELYDAKYRKLLKEDIFVLNGLIQIADVNKLKERGSEFISNCLKSKDIYEICVEE